MSLLEHAPPHGLAHHSLLLKEFCKSSKRTDTKSAANASHTGTPGLRSPRLGSPSRRDSRSPRWFSTRPCQPPLLLEERHELGPLEQA
eukprot:CAMPEP_0185554124 /NCGR_PEP_ID=MMETSP1381-20130426/40216_1 /TAXON_ID=298111 /ORGANISM="Pavlova sp., Strain CCMP459" /LENGTH=87 /DNA_ID=CAMNT_0028167301 /DNA_START=356 /DNA_END=615 /DNA_ORIENTATION=+